MSIEENYSAKCAEHSDINEHLPTLRKYAQLCQHVTEMGVRDVVSTWAFLAARPKKLVSYDIAYHPNIAEAQKVAYNEDLDWQFILGDTTKVKIEYTELLFIDTLHNYTQLDAELTRHHNKVSSFIIMHDTTIFADKGEEGDTVGLWPAIQKFLDANHEWYVKERFTNNNGLTILAKNIEILGERINGGTRCQTA